MRMENFPKAIFCFGNTISINDRNDSAWGNIANCYAAQKKPIEALACSEQALKCNRDSWRLWHNMIRFSIDCKNFYKAVFAIVELLRKGKHEGLNAALLVKVSDVFLSNYALAEDKKTLN